MTLQQLQYFIAAAKYMNHTHAAKSLYVSKSTLSHSFKKLESELGASLMVRNDCAWCLTPEGESFLECAKVILNTLDEWKKKQKAFHLILLDKSLVEE